MIFETCGDLKPILNQRFVSYFFKYTQMKAEIMKICQIILSVKLINKTCDDRSIKKIIQVN